MTEKKVKKDPIDWRIIAVAMFCLTCLGLGAMFSGINGKFFALIIGAICALGGLSLPQLKLAKH